MSSDEGVPCHMTSVLALLFCHADSARLPYPSGQNFVEMAWVSDREVAPVPHLG